VHLVGFIIRIYHDAQSPGRQINPDLFLPALQTVKYSYDNKECGKKLRNTVSLF